MKFNAALDVNVVAHESVDEVAVLLDLQAPASAGDTPRVPSTLQIVLDRSGSMSGPPLEGAKSALVALVQRLEPTDNFGVVTFDSQAQVVVPTGPLTDKADVVRRIESIRSGGMTDLSAGYLRALRELRRVDAGTGGTVLVVSDGHVNAGIGDPDEFAQVTAQAYGQGVVTSTLGYGEGYDETLLVAMARSGSGNHVFAADPDAAGAAITAEVDGLLDKVVQGATLTISLEPAVTMLRLYNDLPAQQLADGSVMVELGDLYADEERKLLLRLQVPAVAALGLAQVATLQVQYVELPGLVEHSLTLPISVNVVPGDEAAGRVPDPVVRSEVLFQEAQASKREASEAFERGDLAEGRAKLADVKRTLGEANAIAPAVMAASIDRELQDVDRMSDLSTEVTSSHMSKVTRDSYHRQNRKRGRRPE
jgi:Ca-activated chloride channel family protein